MSGMVNLHVGSIDEMGKRFVDAWHQLENGEEINESHLTFFDFETMRGFMSSSDEAERLARVYATALFVWNSDDDAKAFLHAPHPMLQGRTPLEVSSTEDGARRVEQILQRLLFGISS